MADQEYKPPQCAPLLYYFAGVQQVPGPFRGRLGLESGFWGRLRGIAGGEKCAHKNNIAGPDGGRGLLCTPFDAGTDPGSFLGYWPERQDWTEIEANIWLGIDRDAAPHHFSREELATPKYYLDHDRGQWLIPVALIDVESCGLPCQDQYQRGEWHTVPRPGYADLAERARYLYEVECGEVEEPSREWLRDTAIAAIGCNYAITAAEMGALDLLNNDTYTAVSEMLTDAQDRREKKEPA